MSTNKVWQECSEIGKIGEFLFKEYMEYKGNICLDARNHPLYRELDIDFIVQDHGDIKNVEVKTDTKIWKTGNFVSEKWENYGNSRGWFYKTRADLIAICDSHNEILYIFPMRILKDYIAEYEDELRLIAYREQSYDNSDNYCTRQCWLIKMKKFIKYCEKVKSPIERVDICEIMI